MKIKHLLPIRTIGAVVIGAVAIGAVACVADTLEYEYEDPYGRKKEFVPLASEVAQAKEYSLFLKDYIPDWMFHYDYEYRAGHYEPRKTLEEQRQKEEVKKVALLPFAEKKALAELQARYWGTGCVSKRDKKSWRYHIVSLTIAYNSRAPYMREEQWDLVRNLKHLVALRLEEHSYNPEYAIEVVGKMENLKILLPPGTTRDSDLADLKNLNNLEVLILGNVFADVANRNFLIPGSFIEKLSPDSKLRLILVNQQDTAFEIRFLEKLCTLKNFLYIEVAGNREPFSNFKLYKSAIPDYVKDCIAKGYTTTSQSERQGYARMKPELERIAKWAERSKKNNKRIMELYKQNKQKDRNALALSAVFSERMVLQREMPVPIWGTVKAGAEVVVSFAGQTKSTHADAKGDWMVRLEPLPASGENRVLTVTGNGKTIEIKDVLVGDVWLCTGGDEMDYDVATMFAFEEKNGKPSSNTLRGINNPNIRVRVAAPRSAPQPQRVFSAAPWKDFTEENLRKDSVDEAAYSEYIDREIDRVYGRKHTGFSALAAQFGFELNKKLDVPIGLIQLTAAEMWIGKLTPQEGFRLVPEMKHYVNTDKEPSRLAEDGFYNGSIHPLVPFALRGVVFYDNTREIGWHSDTYVRSITAFIKGWRTIWEQGDFPFYFVQSPVELGGTREYGRIVWEQQAFSLTIPNTGMVVTNDFGFSRMAHYESLPKDGKAKYLRAERRGLVVNKNFSENVSEVASRLARLALSRTYGVKFPDDCGTLFQSAKIADGGEKIIVEFAHANSGLTTRDGAPPSHFELAGSDGVFHPATAVIVGKNVVEVSSKAVPQPTRVHFAWRNDACPNLMNNEKLPAGAFRWPVP